VPGGRTTKDPTLVVGGRLTYPVERRVDPKRGGVMLNIGGTEILVVMVLALLLLGPKRLPEVGEMLGRSLRKFRQATREIREEVDIMSDVDDEPRRKK
jgi:TatA/E family protein of Tat protein translocase